MPRDPEEEVKKRKDAMDHVIPATETYKLEKPKRKRSQPKPTTPDPKGPIQVNISVERMTDDNLGFVLAQLRFYQFDARNYDNPGKYPFKIYETAWELGNVVKKKKVAEFATKEECAAAFVKIKDAYAQDFRRRYQLIERGQTVDCDYPAAIDSRNPVSQGVPRTGTEQQQVPPGTPQAT